MLVVLSMAALAAASPGPDEVALAKAIGDRVAGKPVACIDYSPSGITATEVIPGTAIVYRINGRFYVNRPSAGAEALRRDDILVTRVMTGQLCRIDPVELRDPTSPIPRGVVVLGDFVPYARPGRAR